MHYLSGILILYLVIIICFTNIIGYLSAIIFINYYKISDKYPKLNKFLSYFENPLYFGSSWKEFLVIFVFL